MNGQAKNAVYVLVIGAVLMIIGQAWGMVADSDYQKAFKDEIEAYDDVDTSGYVNALWDEYDAFRSANMAYTVLNVGMIVAFLGIAVLAVGMIPQKPVLVQQVYPPGYQVMQAPPTQPGYQEPPRQW